MLGHPVEAVILSSEGFFLFLLLMVFSLFALWSLEWWLYHCNASALSHRWTSPTQRPGQSPMGSTRVTSEITASQLLHFNASKATFQSELSAAICSSSRVRVTVNTETRPEMLPRISPPQRSMFVILCNKFIIKTWMASKSNLLPSVSHLNYFPVEFIIL